MFGDKAVFFTTKAYNFTYTSPIANISSICKTINISSIQVHSRNEAMEQHCKHENDPVHWHVFGGGDV